MARRVSLAVGVVVALVFATSIGGGVGTTPAQVSSCVVPDIINVRLQPAEQLLQDAGCNRGPVKGKALGSNLYIFMQRPRAGASLPAGGQVDVGLSKYKRKNPNPNCSVPNLIGRTLKAASKRLPQAGCAFFPGAVTKRPASGRASRIIEQYPRAGRTIKDGGLVKLVVGPTS
jgi:beta-lactam-binding protein with PASTA domain